MKNDSPLTNTLDIVLTDVDQLNLELAAAKRETVRVKQVIQSAYEALSCAGKASLKDRAVMATTKILTAEAKR